MNAANGVKVEQLLGDDGEDSNMAILRNDSIADPSCKNSDGDLAAKKPSGFYSHAEDVYHSRIPSFLKTRLQI